MPNIRFHTLLLMCLALVVSLFVSCTSDDTVDAVPDSHKVTTDPIAIEFDNYVARSVSRGSIIDKTSILGADEGHGFGVYAMYTSDGKKYVSESEEKTDEANFSDNFMSHQHVYSTETSFDNSTTATSWTYTPLKYWPSTSSEYISFLAYAPWSSSQFNDLYSLVSTSTTTTDSKTETSVTFDSSTGDRTYIKYDVNGSTSEDNSYADARKTVDLMFNSNDALNQQLYVGTEGNYVFTDNFVTTTTDNIKTLTKARQRMNFKHATARVAFAITSSALENANNFKNDEKTSDAKITVTRFILSGAEANGKNGDAAIDPGSDIDFGAPRRPNFAPANTTTATTGFDIKNLKGAFVSQAYLNLDPKAESNKRWNFTSSPTKIWFGFNGNAGEETVKATNGEPQTVKGTVEKTTDGKYNWKPNGVSTVPDNQYAILQATRAADAKSTDDGTIDYHIGSGSDCYMFIIPQDFTSSGSSAGGGYIYDKNTQTLISGPGFIGSSESEKTLYCHIDYEVTYNSVTSGLGSAGNPITYSATGVISKNFEAGKAYLILIDIGGTSGSTTSFKPISFTVDSVDGWGDETSSSTSE